MTGTEPDGRIAERADQLLPEERRAGSDDPRTQAAAVLADSDERMATLEDRKSGDEDADENGAPDAFEHRHSEDTVEP